MPNNELIALFSSFLNEVGIPTAEGKVPSKSFLPKVTIKDGGIVYDAGVDVSDILHEAGHLAIIPGKYRHLCQADMEKSQKEIWKIAEAAGEIEADTPIYCALIQSGDAEATAWAWAAGKYIGVPDKQIVLPHQYEGTGEDVRVMLAARCYCGINGLRAAAMIDSVKSYPKLTRWVQP